jgi:hypothetical protein
METIAVMHLDNASSRPANSACWCAFLLIVVLLAAGCGKTGTINGRVTVDGVDAYDSAVLVCDGTGWSVLGPVGANGRYRVKGVPVGPVSAIILPPPTSPGVTYPYKVPPRYEQHESSGLRLEVHRGSNVFDIPMTSRK